MLLELRVKNLGIIADIDWKLDTGLNVITGETGAGKSLVIDAVELLLFGTSGEDVIRSGASEARIEGIFAVTDGQKYHALKEVLIEKGLIPYEDTLIIIYEVRKQKPAVVRVNGHTITKTVLRQVGQLLIDIHGQSEHLSLLDNKYQLDFLDAYARAIKLRDKFTCQVSQLHKLQSEIRLLKEKEQDYIRQEDFLKYQIEEISQARLRNGEDEELERERRTISLSEKLKEYSTRIYQLLHGGEGGDSSSSALIKLNEALQVLKRLVELNPKLTQQLDYLDKTIYGIEEIARDVRSYGDNLANDPQRLDEIETRLEIVRNLKRKYGKTISEILSYLEKSEKELEGISISSERKEQLEKEIIILRKGMGQLASELSSERAQAAARLKTDVMKELQDLDMARTQFEVQITQTQSVEGIEGADGKTYAFNNEGIDNVDFMISTNPGEPLKPLAKIASTGEMSRFTLAMKSALSEVDNIPVLIFDEIDIGVGGRSGDTVGKKLWALSRNHQVICVTHLPQIAVYADAHYCVKKENMAEHTTSILKNLGGSSRIDELSMMLAGPGYSETVRDNACELMRKATDWKQMQSRPTQLKF